MSDIDFTELDPVELADELSVFSTKYAIRTGDYEMASTMSCAADWLRKLAEEADA